MLEKWKKAVIHLECATDSLPPDNQANRVYELQTLFEQGQITQEKLSEELTRGVRDVRWCGTALLLVHEGRRYLLTARHVLWDEMSAVRKLEEEKLLVLGLADDDQKQLIQHADKDAQSIIFSIVFRIPSVDEVRMNRTQREFLMNLGAGGYSTAPYTFSEPDLDLALISLDQRNSRFANELIDLGFLPIDSSDIADGPEFEGQEVFTIGFPSSTAIVGQVQQHPALTQWSSSSYSLPVSSFGRVSMLHGALPFFWADMSIYPGNSGGPVVANDRLVGVVSAQAVIPIEDNPNVFTRIPFGKIIKTSFVRKLLDEQVRKDNWINNGHLNFNRSPTGAGGNFHGVLGVPLKLTTS